MGVVGLGASSPSSPDSDRKWLSRLAYRVAGLQRGRAYSLLLILPEGDADPSWSFVGEGKLEEGETISRGLRKGKQ